jgi:hypothetical protein
MPRIALDLNKVDDQRHVKEIWVNGQIDRSIGVIVGLNAQHRVEISGSARLAHLTA